MSFPWTASVIERMLQAETRTAEEHVLRGRNSDL